MAGSDSDKVLEIVDHVLGDLQLRDRMFTARRPDPERPEVIVIQTGEDGRRDLPTPNLEQPPTLETFIAAAQTYLREVYGQPVPLCPACRNQRPFVTAESDTRTELGALLELLHRADAPFTTVQATYRIWRHDQRAAAAFHADIEEQKRLGAAISTYGPGGDCSAAVEHEELLRIWRSGDRFREQREGGPRDRFYGVRVGNLWWIWDQQSAVSNEDDPTVGSGVGEELSVMLDPTSLLGALRFRVLGRSQQAGRATISAEAVPRPSDPRRAPRSFELHQLGIGAHCYTLDIDAERGVLLAVTALREDEPFHQITTLHCPDTGPRAP